ncbi:DNA-binding domain-containing protein [Ferrimonas pelagia]|uniref:DUF2063 domain-containing protein n=1 Tax=Ferrimonas pelagia TaxID=1177826 RepID=A0ABP9F1M8_9GAMM
MTTDLSQMQQEFMAYIRAPEVGEPPSGVEARRMAVYRELMFNNVSGFVNSGFPVLRALTATPLWQQRLRHFFAQHDCHSPLFVDIAKEFLAYLRDCEGLRSWEAALADYEYLELQIDTLPEVLDQPLLLEPEAVLTQPLCCYRAAKLAQYDYPVQRLGEACPEVDASPTFLLVYRDRDDEIAFIELNALTARLLEALISEPGQTAQGLILTMAEALPDLAPEIVAQGAGQILLQMAQLGVVRAATAA